MKALAATLILIIFTGFTLADDHSLRVAVNLVLLDVSVTDKTGHFVKNLRKEDFKVYEDKVEQPISYVNIEESPVSWGLVIDRSGSMRDMREVYDAAVHMIDQGTTKDEMFVMTFSRDIDTFSEFTLDRVRLQNSLFGLHSKGTTAFYDAMGTALDYMKRASNRRKALLVITDAGDNSSVLRFGTLMDRIRESDVLIYTVGMTIPARGWEARKNLQELAEVTGGFAHFPTDMKKCKETMEEIAQEAAEHYTIGYYPTNGTYDQKWRKVRLVATDSSAAHAKYIARTRTGYFAMSSN